MLVVPESDLRGLISPADAVVAIEDAFARLARGEVIQPAPMSFDLPDAEVHVKGAYALGGK